MGSQLGVLRTMLTDSQVEENEGSEGYEDSFTDDDDFSEGCVDEIVRPGTFEYNLYCSSGILSSHKPSYTHNYRQVQQKQ